MPVMTAAFASITPVRRGLTVRLVRIDPLEYSVLTPADEERVTIGLSDRYVLATQGVGKAEGVGRDDARGLGCNRVDDVVYRAGREQPALPDDDKILGDQGQLAHQVG
ncbi:hypothetical protein [Streptosporangium vulgare]|uniref:Uncharacterized protein n=1 Tax=Streptosporangium vulgare TaxID=46190 RepID=A0ABV5TCI8_9ACTN